MSFLYKDPKDVKISVSIKEKEGIFNFLFTANCGKFGTDEIIDEYDLNAEQLLDIFKKTEE